MAASVIAPQIEACDFLTLRELNEMPGNKLVLVLDEMLASGPEAPITIGDNVLHGSRPLGVVPESRAFELRWERYIAHSVINESFCMLDDEQSTVSGRLVRIHTRSHFLTYVTAVTWGSEDYPGPLTHVEVLCSDQIINVAAVGLPAIRQLPAGSGEVAYGAAIGAGATIARQR